MTSWVGRTAEGVDSGGRDAGPGRRHGTRRLLQEASGDYRLLPVWMRMSRIPWNFGGGPDY